MVTRTSVGGASVTLDVSTKVSGSMEEASVTRSAPVVTEASGQRWSGVGVGWLGDPVLVRNGAVTEKNLMRG